MKTRINQSAVALLIAFIISIGSVQATKRVTKASGHESIIETSLELENWMTDEGLWNTASALIYMELHDEIIELESWMTDSDVWKTTESFDYKKKSETSLELEGWMTDESTWSMAWVPEVETEKDLAIEYWMMNENIW